MSPRADPPPLARRLLEASLPPDVREDVSGDLEEMFRRRLAAHSPSSARLWYWRQTAAFSTRFAAERLRQRRMRTDMTTGFSWIDFKLAVRMLVRYPGLTLVAVIGMAAGIAIATAAFTVVTGLLDPSLPFEEGDRIVAIVNTDAQTNNREARVMYDLAAWRELDSLEDVGAFRTVGRNLIAPGAQPETVSVAQMTASGFRLTRVAPLLGRPLLPEDERAAAPDVVVIGHDVWTRRFASDPGILGREIQLGATEYTVVGVMPEGFAFPVNHSFWVPWRLEASTHEPRSGPSIEVFARLAPGATLDGVQAQLTAIAQRHAAASPSTHEHLRPRVTAYVYGHTDMDDPENYLALHAVQSAIVLLLVLVCVNVAILVYARTASRQGEIAVRSALGASRRRIVAQLFLEALVLAGVGALVGVAAVAFGLRQLEAALVQIVGSMPFWMHLTLSMQGALYVVALTLFAAAIVGAIPALKATGRGVQARLQGLSAGSGSRMQMGRLWTALIVAQVGVAVALLPAAVFHAWDSLRFRASADYEMRDFLTASVVMETPAGATATGAGGDETRRYALRLAEFERALEADGAVAGATFSMTPPGGEWALVLEFEGLPPPVDPVDYNIIEGTKRGHLVRFNRVAPDYFSTYGVPLLMGTGLEAQRPKGVLVDRAFAERLLGGENPLGRRIRYVGRSREANADDVQLEAWYEIVGVVETFPADRTGREAPRVFHAAAPGELYPARAAVRVRGGSPTTFAGRLREIGAAVDPLMQLRNISSVEDVIKREQRLMRLIGMTITAVTLSVLVLTGAGIYALMSFTVARRRKEIGIRTALGADPRRILTGIFSRALRQLVLGAALGMGAAVGLEQLLEGETFQGHGAVVLPLVAVLITGIGLLAAWGPARRGLRIQPIEALREE